MRFDRKIVLLRMDTAYPLTMCGVIPNGGLRLPDPSLVVLLLRCSCVHAADVGRRESRINGEGNDA